jgi:parallel beta-helix repeat protein
MKMKKRDFRVGLFGLLLGFLGLLAGAGGPAQQGPTVCPQGPPTCPFAKIQDALNAARPGDLITVAPGTYPEAPVVRLPNLTLLATDRGQAVITGSVEIRADGVHVEGFSVRGWLDARQVQGVTIKGNHIEVPVVERGIHLFVFGQLNVIEENRIINHHSKTISLLITGEGNIVRMNTLENKVRGFWGIVVRGSRNLIEGNRVIGFEYCIQTEDYSGNFILRNSVRGCGQAISLATPTHPLQYGHQNVVLGNTIEESHIGIEVGASSETRIQGNEIRNNNLGIVIGEVARPGQPLYIRGNNIRGNKQFGIKNWSGTLIDARHNWWGDASGPAHSTNPQGRGDPVSDDVAFRPWLTQPLILDLFPRGAANL